MVEMPEPKHWTTPFGVVENFTADQLRSHAAACVEEALESIKFHPSASHVEPNFRDWFNATIDQRLRELKQEGNHGPR